MWYSLDILAIPFHNMDIDSKCCKTYNNPGARFINDFLPGMQIQWKVCLAVILLLAIRSQQISAHATTAQLSCHVQNFAAITVSELRWERIEISIEFELRWKNR